MTKNKHNMSALFDEDVLKNTLRTYNPWWESSYEWQNPMFKREYFRLGVRHFTEDHRLALLINGPRRVGKTTVMRQLMEYLMNEKLVDPKQIFFFSLDDPFIQQLPISERGGAFEKLLSEWEKTLGEKLSVSKQIVYCFLDEVQRLPNWELYIKRYVDLRYPIKFVISGSASHTIFRKSLESLLGRLVDISMPPFSFREWLRFHFSEYADICELLADKNIDIRDGASLSSAVKETIDRLGEERVLKLFGLVGKYAEQGGFPQLWTLDPMERAQFVDLQFVQRVTLEDLRLIKEIRRPEIFHQFLRYAFARTGEEYNLEDLAGKIQTTRVTLSGALPLLLQTELIRKVERYTGKPVRLRSTHTKLYAADTMLYEAITKEQALLVGPEKGRIAETLTYNVIRRFAGITDISYFRSIDGDREVDFIVRIGRALVPIEIKYRATTKTEDSAALEYVLREHPADSSFGILVTEREISLDGNILKIPLGLFLLLC